MLFLHPPDFSSIFATDCFGGSITKIYTDLVLVLRINKNDP